MNVSELMTSNPRAVRAYDNLAVAAAAMWEDDCGALPVLDDTDRVTGIIEKPLFCMPENVPMSQVNTVVTSYIKAHPERKDDSAAMLVIDALGGKFPCKD